MDLVLPRKKSSQFDGKIWRYHQIYYHLVYGLLSAFGEKIPVLLKNSAFGKLAGSTMILGSCENITKTPMGEKSFHSINAWSYCCIKNFKTYISVAVGIQTSTFAQRWELNDKTTALGLHCRRGTQIWEISFYLFGKVTIYLILGVHVNATFHQVWQNTILFAALHSPCNDS